MARCEGWTRKGGIFSLGPVTWSQCENEATVMIEFKQGDEGVKTLPGCSECWQKCIDSDKIEILSVVPILPKVENEKVQT